jgi:hypothetical protein
MNAEYKDLIEGKDLDLFEQNRRLTVEIASLYEMIDELYNWHMVGK